MMIITTLEKCIIKVALNQYKEQLEGYIQTNNILGEEYCGLNPKWEDDIKTINELLQKIL